MLLNVITSKIKKKYITHKKSELSDGVFSETHQTIQGASLHVYIYIYILEFWKNELDIKVRSNFIDNPKSCFASVGS